MTGENQDGLIRAYARLSALRSNVEKMKEYSVTETYVREFHSVLDKLEMNGLEVSDFRIPDSLVKPRITSSGFDGRSYSEEKYADRSFLLLKLDAILGYFEIVTSEKPKTIGFRAPNRG